MVRRLHDRCIYAEVLSTSQSGKRILIPRIGLAPNDVNLPFILERCQFPVRLAYYMTINKAQGQTFSTVGIYLPQPVFAHGQLYVAFSRARAFADIHVCVRHDQDYAGPQPTTTNVVYKEILYR